jgi:hypothetical protein
VNPESKNDSFDHGTEAEIFRCYTPKYELIKIRPIENNKIFQLKEM